MDKDQKKPRWRSNIKFEPQYILFFFSSMVLLFFVIAFTRPVYPAPLQETIESTTTPVVEDAISQTEGALTATPTLDPEPPTPEEIGYTDGIIFWATFLVIIMLVATLRETLHRKGE